MQLIVVTNPTPLANEAELINALFDEGLERLHLRKPDYTESEFMQLLDKIDSKNYSKVALHQHHRLAEECDIKRLHFTETKRNETSVENLEQLKTKGFTLSTSIHSIDYLYDWNVIAAPEPQSRVYMSVESASDGGSLPAMTATKELVNIFDYVFYGPVFDSISKQGYKAQSNFALTENKNRTTKIFAIGGIDASKINLVKQANYDGAAILGTIWQNTNQAINNFKLCLKNVNTH